ncbi:hypothetical protein BSKO_08442 [Bryopsis sp. KO-2023]|nr:hypothetical protein BSKO_08442 [Bryopsis sp. KO-2023]
MPGPHETLERLLRDIKRDPLLDSESDDDGQETGIESPPADSETNDCGKSEGSIDFSDLLSDDGTETYRDRSSLLPGSIGGESPAKGINAELKERLSGMRRALAEKEIEAARALKQKNEEIKTIKECVAAKLEEMNSRQRQIESTAPSIQIQMQEARAALKFSHVSDEIYKDILKVPEAQRSISDAVKVAIYESLQESKQDNEILSANLATTQAACARFEREAVAAQRECAKAQEESAAGQLDFESRLANLQARDERLTEDLEAACVRAEVNNAKAEMYDRLAKKANDLETEVRRLSSLETLAGQKSKEREQMAETLTQANHKIEVLSLDKAYLTKDIGHLAERCEMLQADNHEKVKKIEALKKEQSDLYEKMLANESEGHDDKENWMQRELVRLQSTTQSDIERIRKESMEMYDREARLLREFRDRALVDANQANSANKELKSLHEDLLLKHRDLQKKNDITAAELTGEVNLKNFELSRLQALLDEKTKLASQYQIQCDMLQEKVRVLTENYYHLDAESSRKIWEAQAEMEKKELELSHYHTIEANVDEAILSAGKSKDNGKALVCLESGVATSMKRRIRQSVALAGRCARLEAEREALSSEKFNLEKQIRRLESDLSAARAKVKLSSQPQGMIFEELENAEVRAEEAARKVQNLEAALISRESQVAALRDERDEIRKDLERVLHGRSNLDAMKGMVAVAIKDSKSGQRKKKTLMLLGEGEKEKE